MCPWKEPTLGLNEREHSCAAVVSAKDRLDSCQAVLSQVRAERERERDEGSTLSVVSYLTRGDSLQTVK